MATQWRGFQAPGKEEESKKFAFLINNGRANHVWQSAYLDQQRDFVMNRWPYPIHPDEPGRHEGVWACRRAISLRCTTTTARRKRWPIRPRRQGASRRSCCSPYPTGVQGNVVSPGVNELIIPNYKQTWGNIRKIASAPGAARATSFKSWEYQGLTNRHERNRLGRRRCPSRCQGMRQVTDGQRLHSLGDAGCRCNSRAAVTTSGSE